MELSPLMVAWKDPLAGVEFAGVSLNPRRVARRLLRDSSSALSLVTKPAVQSRKMFATARYFAFIWSLLLSSKTDTALTGAVRKIGPRSGRGEISFHRRHGRHLLIAGRQASSGG